MPSTTLFVVDGPDLPPLGCGDQLGLVRTSFSWSSKFCNNERPKTGPRLWSFPVLGISSPDLVQVRSSLGFFAVSRLDLQALNGSDTRNTPMWVCFWCSRRKGREGGAEHPEHGLMGRVLVFETEGMHQTSQTCPCGACFWCSKRRRCVRHHKHALVGRVSGVRDEGEVPDTENMPHWACFRCLARGDDGAGRTPKTCPCGRVLGVRRHRT